MGARRSYAKGRGAEGSLADARGAGLMAISRWRRQIGCGRNGGLSDAAGGRALIRNPETPLVGLSLALARTPVSSDRQGREAGDKQGPRGWFGNRVEVGEYEIGTVVGD